MSDHDQEHEPTKCGNVAESYGLACDLPAGHTGHHSCWYQGTTQIWTNEADLHREGDVYCSE